MEEVLTTTDVANFLRFDVETVQRLLNKGKLPGIKIGREWRIPKTALEEHLNEEARKNKEQAK